GRAPLSPLPHEPECQGPPRNLRRPPPRATAHAPRARDDGRRRARLRRLLPRGAVRARGRAPPLLRPPLVPDEPRLPARAGRFRGRLLRRSHLVRGQAPPPPSPRGHREGLPRAPTRPVVLLDRAPPGGRLLGAGAARSGSGPRALSRAPLAAPLRLRRRR